MFNFRLRGCFKNSDDISSYEVLYKNGKLYGDRKLVQALKAEVKDISDAIAVISAMRLLCTEGKIWGNYPEWRNT
ncbi:hypothetical protein P2R12_20670 [Cytobacillus oceanisediminis]|uniref:hypothetical protein n=1 Tax=Cytobacillus oceanisediminis TaxID=665099 RepID=UPI0023D9FE32|nr:hypothetical protein [Cytobacillus oceanisediminis]MDF2039350.1 hypothetical protein [Cytobacillus oceanisediminis]